MQKYITFKIHFRMELVILKGLMLVPLLLGMLMLQEEMKMLLNLPVLLLDRSLLPLMLAISLSNFIIVEYTIVRCAVVRDLTMGFW